MIKNLKEPYGESARGRQIKIKNSSAGMTLIEIIVVIFIVAIFSLILIGDFPEIEKRYALSGAAYKLAQDVRRAQDLGLSAVQLLDVSGSPIAVKGYGIYVNLAVLPTTQYIIYADVDGSQTFNNDLAKACNLYDLSPGQGDTGDCKIETININENNQSLYIEGAENVVGNNVSVNFSPPGPTINIENLAQGHSEISIILGVGPGITTRAVLINTSGLISVQ